MSDWKSHGTRLLSLTLAAVLAGGCYTTRRVPVVEGRLQRHVRPGDELQITTLDGRWVHLRVSEVTDGEVSGVRLPAPAAAPDLVPRQVSVPIPTIVDLQRTRISRGKTAAAIVGWSVGGTFLLLSLAAWITSGSPVINSADGGGPWRSPPPTPRWDRP